MLLYLLAFIIVALTYWFRVAVKHPSGFPDGPRLTLPILGDAIAIGTNLGHGLEQLRKKYGDVYGLYMGPRRSVVVSDFDLIQEVGSHPDFQSRQDHWGPIGMRGQVGDGEGGTTCAGVIFSVGKTWVEQRRYALHKLRDLGFGKGSMENMIAEEVQELCKKFEQYKEKPVNIRYDFNLAVVNSLWTVITSERLDYDDPQMVELINLMDQFIIEGGQPLQQLALMYKYIASIAGALKLSTGPLVMKKLFSLIENVVTEHESTYQETSLRDFTDHYLKEIKTKSNSTDTSSFKGKDGRSNLLSLLNDFFIAGTETTSNTLSWAMLYMILNPDIQEKVQKELDEVTGRGRLPATSDRLATPYTEAVIHEIQRLADLIPLSVVHTASKDSLLGGKYFIPKGTDLYSNLSRVMHDPQHFPDPYKFDPTRYLNSDGKFVPHPMIVPFGVGKRRCLGETLARMSLYVFFTGIVSNFNLKKANESDILSTEPMFGGTSTPQPYKMRFIPRN